MVGEGGVSELGGVGVGKWELGGVREWDWEWRERIRKRKKENKRSKLIVKKKCFINLFYPLNILGDIRNSIELIVASVW